MLSRIKTLFKPKLKTLNTIFISKAKILNNLEQLKTLQPKSAFFPVLKSNAYGYGILPMLEILKGQDFPYLAVDSFPEYQLIHKQSQFKTLIIGETHAENYRHFDHKRTAFAIYNLSTLQELANLKRPISIHLFLNTGMNREGIQIEHLGAFLAFLKEKKQINLEGVMSHLHSADTDKESIKTQIAQFKTMTAIIEKNGFSPKRKHLGASAGLGIIQDDFFTAWRPGIALYGYAPSENRAENIKLQPALRLESTIISLQSLAS